MNNQKTLALMLLSLGVSIASVAQEQKELMEMGEYKYNDATQLWMQTNNAAGLSADSLKPRSIAYFNYKHHDGNLHRVQEGSMRNSLEFFTESYQKINNLLYGYGKFRFEMGQTKGRAWADVVRPYNSNPYFPGSAVLGAYDNQNIDLTAALGTCAIGNWRLGARLDYNLGDLSRLRDPRSRSRLLEYKFTPSAIYSLGAHSVGAAVHYNRRKETIRNVVTVADDPNINYYYMSGLENAQEAIRGYNGYNREWVNHNFGAELSYGYKSSAYSQLTTISAQRGSESVLGTYKYEPGHYYNYVFGLQTNQRLEREKLLHEIDFSAKYEEAYADEYRQELITETDAYTGVNSYHYNTLMTFKKRFQLHKSDLSLGYRLNLKDNDRIKGYFGLKGNMEIVRQKHLLEFSEMQYTRMDWTLSGGHNFLNNRLWVEASAGVHNSLKHHLNLADYTTPYASSVLVPDMRSYYAANYFKGTLAVTYQFPLSIKGYKAMWFVKAYGDYAHSNNHLHKNTVGISVGLFN